MVSLYGLEGSGFRARVVWVLGFGDFGYLGF